VFHPVSGEFTLEAKSMIATSLLLAVTTAAGSPQPSAAPGPTIAVLAVSEQPGPGPELAILARALHDALVERRRSALAPDEIRRRITGRTTSASLSELDRAYMGAEAEQRVANFDGASRTLRAVVEDLERLPESEEAATQWSRALLRLAYVESSLGHKPEARALVEQLLRADPSARPDPELYPPGFAKQVEQVRTELGSRPKHTLSVKTGGRPARIFVEGRDRGPSPVTLSLAPGEYRVSALSGSAVVRGGVADLTQGDQALAIDLALAEEFRPDAGPGLAVRAAEQPSALVNAGATLGAGLVLAVSAIVEKDVRHLSAALYDVRRGRLQREGRIRLNDWTAPAGAIPALVEFLLNGAQSELVITKPDLSVSVGPRSAPGVDLRGAPPPGNLKGWVAFSSGVLAIGVGAFAAYEGFTASGKYSSARGMLTSDGTLKLGQSLSAYNSARSDGDQAASLARYSAGAAVGLAATSAVLGYLSYRETGEIGPFRF
jgi:hypothetical protein